TYYIADNNHRSLKSYLRYLTCRHVLYKYTPTNNIYTLSLHDALPILNDNYINEIPSITLIKPHGSINWEKYDESILINNEVVAEPVVVEPDGYESATTFESNHFHEMLRTFQMELDKPQSVLFVIGFSFQDKHIARMVKRAAQNPELIIFVFGFTNNDREIYLRNLNFENESHNFKVLTPQDFDASYCNKHIDDS